MTSTSHSSKLVHSTKTRAQAKDMDADKSEVSGDAKSVSVASDQRRLESPAAADRTNKQDLGK